MFPEAIQKYADGAAMYDRSSSEEARVWFLDKEQGFYLKTAPAGTLEREAKMTSFFHSLGLSAKVLHYGTYDDSDYLVTERIPGEPCIYPVCLDAPERLCDTIAQTLRELHEQDGSGCPVTDRVARFTEAVKFGADGSYYEPDLFPGLWEFRDFPEAFRVATDGLPHLHSDTLIHGDYCLPNILLSDWKLTGFIDLGDGGIADRHMDILWGVATLNFNLHTTAYTERFLDAYGRDRVEPEKLRCIAAMEMVAK